MSVSLIDFGQLLSGTFNRLVVVLSVASAAAYLVTQSVQPFPGSVAIKGLSVATLALLAFRARSDTDGRLLGGALLFSSLGDVLLDLDPAKLFVFGLGSFLIAHLLYVALFVRNRRKPLNPSAGQKLLVALISLFSAAMILWLLPSLGALAAPVVAYICVITAMCVTAVLMGRRTLWVVFGALLFLVSDSLIAIDKFKMPVMFRDYLVWATYYSGQFLIAVGLLRERMNARPPEPEGLYVEAET